jgi:WD40 repeat protein
MTIPTSISNNNAEKSLIKAAEDILTGIRSNYFSALLGDGSDIQARAIFGHLKTIVLSGETPGQDGTLWRCVRIRPGISPIETLAASLATPDVLLPKGKVVTNFTTIVEEYLRSGSSGLVNLHKSIKDQFHKPFNLLILIDHFDDIFELLPDDKNLQEDRLEFVNFLLKASAWEKAPIYVAVSVSPARVSESYKYGGLVQALQEGSYFYKKLSLSDYLLKVESEFKDSDDVFKNKLIRDIRSETSIEVLDLKWHFLIQELTNKDEQSDLEAYKKVGGLKNVVRFSAEKLYGNLSPNERQISQRIFKACSQTSKKNIVAKPTTLEHIWKLNENTSENPSLKELVELIRKYQTAGILEMIEPTQKVIGQVFFPEKTLVMPVDSLVLNLWPRAISWTKEEALFGFNYQNLVQHAINNKGQINTEDLLNVTELENAKQLFDVERINEAWAAQYFDLKIPIEESTDTAIINPATQETIPSTSNNWSQNYANTLDLAKKYASNSQKKIDNERENKQKGAERSRKRWRWAAIAGGTLALISFYFFIKADRIQQNLKQQNFITALSDAHLIDITFEQRIEVLNEKSIKNQSDVMEYFIDNEIIPVYAKKEEQQVTDAFSSIFNLYESLSMENDKNVIMAVKRNSRNLLSLLAKEDNFENRYYYYALKAHYDNLLLEKDFGVRNTYDSDGGFMALKSHPTNENQFAYINKFGKVYLVERNQSLEKRPGHETLSTIDLKEDAYAISFSTDGKKLFVGTITGKIYSWEVEKLSRLASIDDGEKIADVKEKIYHLEVMEEHGHLFATTKYMILDISHHKAFNTQSGEFFALKKIKSYAKKYKSNNQYKLGEIKTLAISQGNGDKKYLLVGGTEKTLVFDLGERGSHKIGEPPVILEHHNDINTAMDIADNNDLAIGTQLGRVYLFNLEYFLEDNEKIYFIDEIFPEPVNFYDKQVTSMDFIKKDNKTLLAYSNIIGQIKITDIDEIEEEFTDLELIGHKGPVRKVVFNNEFELISMEDMKLFFWETSVESLAEELRGLIGD